MWNSLKSDLTEFVGTVTEDASNVLSTLDANFPDAGEDDNDLSAGEQEALRRMTMEETFTAPLKNEQHVDEEELDEEEAKELASFIESFSIDAKTDEIAELLETYPDSLQLMFEQLVPTQVKYDDFWRAYFWRCDAERIERQWAAEEERNRKARQEAVSKGLSQVKSLFHVGGGEHRPPFVMNTAVDESEDEEELGWDDDEDDFEDEEEAEDEADEQIEFKDEQTEKLQNELQQALEERDQLRDTVELQTKEIASLKSGESGGDDGTKKELEKLKMQLFEKESELKAVRASQLDDSRVVPDSAAGGNDEKLSSMKSEMDRLSQLVDAKDSELADMRTQLENAKKDHETVLSKSTADREALDKAMAEQSELKSTLDAKVKSLKADVTSLTAERDSLRESLESAKGGVDSQSAELDSTKEKAVALTQELKKTKASLEESKKQTDELKGELEATKASLKQKEEEADGLREAANKASNAPSPDTTDSTGVKVNTPAVQKLNLDDDDDGDDDWGEDW